MDTDLDLGRYVAGLRRHRTAIVAVALIATALGVLGSLRQPTRATVVVQAAPKFLDLVSAGLDASEFDVETIADVLATDANQLDFEREVEHTVEGAVDIVATRQLDRPVVLLTVEAQDEATVRRAIDVAVGLLTTQYVSEFSVNSSRVATGFEQRRADATDQLDAINEELRGASSEQRTLVEGLMVQRQALTDRLVSYDATIAALERFGSNLGDDLRTSLVAEPSSRGPVTLGLLGLIAGLVLAIGASLIRTATDRSVRTRRDLARLGLSDLVGVLPKPPSDRSLASASTAIGVLADTLGLDRLQVAPVSTRSPLSWRSNGDRSGVGEVTLRAAISESVDAVENARDGLTVLAVAWGSDHQPEVVRAANELSAAGARRVAVLLYAVPPSEVTGVER